METNGESFTASISLDPLYNGGWITTENNAYFFNSDTDILNLIAIIMKDER